MNTSIHRSLAKVLGPALLLTATLALPVDSFGASSTDPKAHAAMDKDGKDKKQKDVNKNRGQERSAQVQQRNALRKEAKAQKQVQQQQEARRQAQIRERSARAYPRDHQTYRYDDQYDRYYRSGERFHIDGFVFDEGGDCSLLRDHQGHVFALVGNIGDVVQGDHLRLQGRVVDGGLCDWRGTAFEVAQVKTLWDNNRHEHASYDYQRDRISFEEYLDNRY
ncbi:MAG TPA: hypothetical protein VMW27_10415 [Thermoanaerobaculia bacterium]|nr:hypothetical protein [Thermoanaerobaculia bacterium]